MENISEKLEQLKVSDPVVNAALVYYLRGEVSFEQALILAVESLVKQKKILTQNLAQLHAKTTVYTL